MIDTSGWKEFRLDDVFVLKGGFYNKKPEHSIEGDIPFLAASDNENGVTEFYSLDDIAAWDKVGGADNSIDEKMFSAPAIAVTVNGACCNAFYQPNDYTCSHDITSLRPKDGHILTAGEGLFVCTVIRQERYRWSYGRKPHDIKKLAAMTIKLPATLDGDPDWDFMERYMGGLHSKPLTTSNKPLNIPLETEKWGSFRIGDLFEKPYKALAHTKDDFDWAEILTDYSLPYVSRTENNNAVDGYAVGKSDILGSESGNAIVIGDTTSTISYQENQFVCGDHIVILRAEWLNKWTGLFITTILRRERYRYSYGRAFVMSLIENTAIRLPITSDGAPDWQWMEDYMKSLPYSDKIG